jgi:hypothetical protein
MGEVCSTHERGRKFIVLFGRRETQWPLGRSRRGWKGNIQTDVTDRGFKRVDLLRLAENTND